MMAATASMWTILLVLLWAPSWLATASWLDDPDAILKLNYFVQENPATSTFVVPALAGHLGNFGGLSILDQPITMNPANTSLQVGTVRGLAAFARDTAVGAPEVLWTAIFNDTRQGGFGQGSLSFRGSNDLGLAQREFTLVGGSGDYRMVTGYAYMVTYARDSVTRYATGNMTVFLEHSPAWQTYMKIQMGAVVQEVGLAAGS